MSDTNQQQTLTPELINQITASVASAIANTVAEAMAKATEICHKEVLSLQEVSEYTGISVSQLYKYTSERKIPHSKPGGKYCFIRRRDLEEWLMSSPVATETEINTRVMEYCQRKPLSGRQQ